MGYVMLSDRCPHRFAPLSLGKRQADDVVCRYHGLVFAPNGSCIRAPYGGTPPAHVNVKSIPIAARYGLLWFWPGDPALADISKIPDFAFLESQNVWKGRSLFAGNYELLSDNLMDLSHVDHLHGTTFQTEGAHARATFEVRDGDKDTIWSEWRINDARKLPVLEAMLQGVDKIDQLLQMRWSAPSCMALRILWMPQGGTPDQAVFSMINPHIVTPESTSTSHYFWTCEPNIESENLARAVFETEDRPMIEAVQGYMGDKDFWQMKPAILKQDLGAIRVRRRLIKLRHAEHPKQHESTG